MSEFDRGHGPLTKELLKYGLDHGKIGLKSPPMVFDLILVLSY